MTAMTRRGVAAALGTTAAAWMLSVVVAGQAAPDRAPNAEEVFKNIQVLKGIPVDQFMGTMGFFSSSLGLNCTDCHSYDSGGDWAKYADDTPLKRRARTMVTSCGTPGTDRGPGLPRNAGPLRASRRAGGRAANPLP